MQRTASQVHFLAVPECSSWHRDGNTIAATYRNADAVDYERNFILYFQWCTYPLPSIEMYVTFALYLKGARSDHFKFFSNFWRFWYQMKAHIFLITPGEFYS